MKPRALVSCNIFEEHLEPALPPDLSSYPLAWSGYEADLGGMRVGCHKPAPTTKLQNCSGDALVVAHVRTAMRRSRFICKNTSPPLPHVTAHGFRLPCHQDAAGQRLASLVQQSCCRIGKPSKPSEPDASSIGQEASMALHLAWQSLLPGALATLHQQSAINATMRE